MNSHSIAPFIQKFYPQYYSWNTYPIEGSVTIHTLREEWGIFCNFAHTPLTVEGVTFKSAEQLFQTMKFTDDEVVRDIYCRPNPKMRAKHWENEGKRRPDWGSMIVDAMKFCLQTKYDQSSEFRNKLNATTGRPIVEDQTSFRKKSPDTWGVKLRTGADGPICFEGPNLLGRLLMELRDNGKLGYHMPDDAFRFLEYLNNQIY